MKNHNLLKIIHQNPFDSATTTLSCEKVSLNEDPSPVSSHLLSCQKRAIVCPSNYSKTRLHSGLKRVNRRKSCLKEDFEDGFLVFHSKSKQFTVNKLTNLKAREQLTGWPEKGLLPKGIQLINPSPWNPRVLIAFRKCR